MKEAAKGGLTHFTKMNGKILELVSQNHTLLLERVREVEEGCQKQLKEKDEQIKRLQNLLTNKDEHMKKLTSKIRYVGVVRISVNFSKEYDFPQRWE